MDNSDFDPNNLSEEECESSFGSSSQHSAYSLEIHRNEMDLDDSDTNEQEFDDETDKYQSNRISSDVWKHIDKITEPEKPKCTICSRVFSAKSTTTTL